MYQVKLTAIGNSTGLILPKEILALLNAGKGDTLTITRTKDGIALTSYDEKFARQMEVGRKIMREDRDVLRMLAK